MSFMGAVLYVSKWTKNPIQVSKPAIEGFCCVKDAFGKDAFFYRVREEVIDIVHLLHGAIHVTRESDSDRSGHDCNDMVSRLVRFF